MMVFNVFKADAKTPECYHVENIYKAPYYDFHFFGAKMTFSRTGADLIIRVQTLNLTPHYPGRFPHCWDTHLLWEKDTLENCSGVPRESDPSFKS